MLCGPRHHHKSSRSVTTWLGSRSTRTLLSGRISLGLESYPPGSRNRTFFGICRVWSPLHQALLSRLSLTAVSESEGSAVSQLKAWLQGWGRSSHPVAGLSGVRTGPESTTVLIILGLPCPASHVLCSTSPQPLIYWESPNSGCKTECPQSSPQQPSARQSLLN